MKSNGFTLIELLAVAVIISIIATIGFFSIIKIMQKVHTRTLTLTALSVKSAAKKHIMANEIEDEKLVLEMQKGADHAYLLEGNKDPWGEDYLKIIADITKTPDNKPAITVYLQTKRGWYVLENEAKEAAPSENGYVVDYGPWNIQTYQDTYIIGGVFGSRNYGASPSLVAVGTGMNPHRKILIQSFPIEDKPLITSAKLKLKIDMGTVTDFKAYMILKPWNEGTQNDKTALSGETTWTSSAHGSTLWGTEGMSSATGDISAVRIDTARTVQDGWATITLDPAQVNLWRTGSNYGIAIIYGNSGTHLFSSSETADINLRPVWELSATPI